jgi:glycosyltransferase involved in cell wall biosynthesis
MRVALNALHLVPGDTGGGELYARRLVPALLEARPELRLKLFASEEGAPSLATEPWAGDVELVRLPVRARGRVRRVLAEQTLLAARIARGRFDLLHNLFTTAPAAPRVPQVTTILDVIYKRFPETHAGMLAWGMRVLVPLAARRSRRILTLSQAAKDEIVRFLGVPADRVDVAYLGPGMADDVEPVPEAALRCRFELGDRPLLLTVSAKRPHKNLERLIDAVGELAEPAPVLVLPGYPTPFEEALRARAEAAAPGRVRFAAWVDEPTLEGLYRAARCFVFPSLAEGFGLPVLEALRRGVPVACSDLSSLPEVAGDAARYFDPTDSGAIAAAICELLEDEALRERLAAAGRERARRFSWSATAAATLACYERALS